MLKVLAFRRPVVPPSATDILTPPAGLEIVPERAIETDEFTPCDVSAELAIIVTPSHNFAWKRAAAVVSRAVTVPVTSHVPLLPRGRAGPSKNTRLPCNRTSLVKLVVRNPTGLI